MPFEFLGTWSRTYSAALSAASQLPEMIKNTKVRNICLFLWFDFLASRIDDASHLFFCKIFTSFYHRFGTTFFFKSQNPCNARTLFLPFSAWILAAVSITKVDSGLNSAASATLCNAVSNWNFFIWCSANLMYKIKLGSPGANLSSLRILAPAFAIIDLKSSAPLPILTETIRLEST